MKKHIINAILKDFNTIELTYYFGTSLEEVNFFLSDGKEKTPLEKKLISSSQVGEFLLTSKKEILLGVNNKIICSTGEEAYLDYECVLDTPAFNEKYTYSGNDLGAIYSPKKTTFKLYSPLSYKACLKVEKSDGVFAMFEMKHGEHGVFETTINGDLLNKKYCYVTYFAGQESTFNDPYGVAVSLNSKYSAVVDLVKIQKMKKVKPNYKIRGLQDKIIYEVDIRDFTAKDCVRPTYSEFKKKIPYLKKLGVTYVQFLPVLDFDNVDDILLDTYNWGYDPLSFFALEGSYATFPEDPQSRMIEFRELVDELHRNGIRVILDVVYNHVYEYKTSVFEKSFPGYYFRKVNDKICNGSGCGDDFASETVMGRKAIVDSIKHLLTTYDVDGFRFDLLGLIDLETSKQVISEAKAIKPDVTLYGEGWFIPSKLDLSKLTNKGAAKVLPEMGFFNDNFRNTVRGPNGKFSSNGFIDGDRSNLSNVENVLLGNFLSNDFLTPEQSINYVECHDNETLFDKLTNKIDNPEEVLHKIKFANALTILALGTPLLHMGQEFGQSKFGLDNTYNILNVNDFDNETASSREELVQYVSDLIAFRKKYDVFSINSIEEIKNSIDCFEHPNGVMEISVKNPKYLYGYKKIRLLINPTDQPQTFEFDDYYEVKLTAQGLNKNGLIVRNAIVNYCSVLVLVAK